MSRIRTKVDDRTPAAVPASPATRMNRDVLARLAVRPVVVTSAPVPPESDIPLFERTENAELLTARLRVRKICEQDFDQFTALVRGCREQVERFVPIYEQGEDDAAMFARQQKFAIEGDTHGHAWRRLIELRHSAGVIVGCINLNSIQRGMSFEADLACWLAPAFQGRGLGLEVVRGVTSFATTDLPEGLGLHRIHAGISPANAPSIALAQRAGFRRDAAKQSLLRVGERWERHDFFSFDPTW